MIEGGKQMAEKEITDTIRYRELSEFFKGAADIFAEKKNELCEMDARMGDGDLGLTMKKGFSALPDFICEEGVEGDIGKTLMKAGMRMAGLVPSTMGTLMAGGIIEGGKVLAGKSELGSGELCEFLAGFACGIERRGKCSLGDCTILDAADAGAKKAREAADAGAEPGAVIRAAAEGAKAGAEATKNMIPKYGKAAVFAAKAEGVPDQGAVAGWYFMEGLARWFVK